MTDGGTWPWVLMALLGAYHGLNPAMGWLFAVGLGLQDRSRRAVLRALGPIALGHELALGLVVVVVAGLGLLADPAALRVGAAAVLIAFGPSACSSRGCTRAGCASASPRASSRGGRS